VRLSTRISVVLAAAALAIGAAFPVTAWGGSEESSPAPSKKHECKKHKKQKCKKHDKQKCKKHKHKCDTKPHHEPPPPPPSPAPDQKGKCNAGNGNGSDAVTFIEGEHCYGGDPGNSFNAGNRGGDEISTTEPQGGVPNLGGNNHPGP
jgi:hypothetical protein